MFVITGCRLSSAGVGVACPFADCRLWWADVSQLRRADVDAGASADVQCSASECRRSPVSWQMSRCTHHHHWTRTSRYAPALFTDLLGVTVMGHSCYDYSVWGAEETRNSIRVVLLCGMAVLRRGNALVLITEVNLRYFRLLEVALYFGMWPATQFDSAFYPPWDGKMGTSQRAVMLCSGKVTAGLTESNGSLPPGGCLIVTCRLTACTPGSAPCPTLCNEYGKPLPFITILSWNASEVVGRLLKESQNLFTFLVCQTMFWTRCWLEGIHTHSFRNVVVNKGRMSPGDWSVSVLWVSFSALMVMVEDRKDIWLAICLQSFQNSWRKNTGKPRFTGKWLIRCRRRTRVTMPPGKCGIFFCKIFKPWKVLEFSSLWCGKRTRWCRCKFVTSFGHAK